MVDSDNNPPDPGTIIIYELIILAGTLAMLNIGLTDLFFRVAVKRARRALAKDT